MVLRFYRWLPLELEPDYKDGYTCDHCHKEFLDAPFYHEEATGTDYCISCAEAAGHSPHSGLVGSLLFSSGDSLLRDSETNALVSFAYKLDAQTAGIFFVDNSSIVLRLQLNGAIRDALSYVVHNGQIESKLRLKVTEVLRRLPWLTVNISKVFDVEFKLHNLPTIPTPLDDVCLVSFAVNDEYICVRHTENYAQTFDVAQGREIVSKGDMPLCSFLAGTLEDCSKTVAKMFLSSSFEALI